MSILVALGFQPGALNTVLILGSVRDWREPQGWLMVAFSLLPPSRMILDKLPNSSDLQHIWLEGLMKGVGEVVL